MKTCLIVAISCALLLCTGCETSKKWYLTTDPVADQWVAAEAGEVESFQEPGTAQVAPSKSKNSHDLFALENPRDEVVANRVPQTAVADHREEAALPSSPATAPRPEVLLTEPFVFSNETIRTEDDHLVIRGTVQAPGKAEGLQILANQQLVVNRPFSGERRNQVFLEKIPLAVGVNHLRIRSWDVAGQTSDDTCLQVIRKNAVGELYVLAVGINDYDDLDIPDLCFAENDAERFGAFFADHERSPCKKENVRCLRGEEVNRASFLKAIDEHLVRQATDENDMAVLLFSGHGFSDGAGGYYLATRETEMANLAYTSVSLTDLKGVWGKISARRKVFFADACHSGGLTGLKGISTNEIHLGLKDLDIQRENHGDQQVDEASMGYGQYLIASCSANQGSLEAEDLQGGLFTSCLLDGLLGAAESDRDARISMDELIRFLKTALPREAKKRGKTQTPLVEVYSSEGSLLLTK